MVSKLKHGPFANLTRWQAFLCGVVPLALIWGILFCAFTYFGHPPNASHPVVVGAFFALMIAGGLGAFIWASESKPKTYLLAVLVFTAYVIRNGLASIPHLIFLLLACMILRGIWRWFRSNPNA